MSQQVFSYLVSKVHESLFLLRFHVASFSWRAPRKTTRPSFKTVVISGYSAESLGIGRAGALTVQALNDAGCTVIEENMRPLERNLIFGRTLDLPSCDTWIIHANPPEARIALLKHTFKTWAKPFRIGYWAWESSLPPRNWLGISKWFDEIWVPSLHVYDAYSLGFRTAGMEAQICKLKIVAHPVTLLPSHTNVDRHARLRALIMFDPRSDFDRKNPEGAIDAWMRAFPTPNIAELTVKTLTEAKCYPRFEQLKRKVAAREDIRFDARTLSAEENSALIDNCDVIISLHKGEGFGLVLAEAMAMGKVVLATGWSGNMQFMNESNSCPVRFELVAANKQYNGPGARWAEPDLEHAAELLRLLHQNPELREELGRNARRDTSLIVKSIQSAIN